MKISGRYDRQRVIADEIALATCRSRRMFRVGTGRGVAMRQMVSPAPTTSPYEAGTPGPAVAGAQMRPPTASGRCSALTLLPVALLGAAIVAAAPGGAGGMKEGHKAPWAGHLREVDEALATRNVSAAELAWHKAYVAALGARGWMGMVEVGDAYLRIGEVAKGRKVAQAKAREAYLSALFRARSERSVEGVLRTAEAFSALGDREVVEQCLRIAEGLAVRSQDPGARSRVRALRVGLIPTPARTANSIAGP